MVYIVRVYLASSGKLVPVSDITSTFGIYPFTSTDILLRAIGKRAHPLHSMTMFCLICVLASTAGYASRWTPFLPDLTYCHILKYGNIQHYSGDTDGYFVAVYTASHMHARLHSAGMLYRYFSLLILIFCNCTDTFGHGSTARDSFPRYSCKLYLSVSSIPPFGCVSTIPDHICCRF